MKFRSNKHIVTITLASIVVFMFPLAVSGDTVMQGYRKYTLDEVMTPAERQRFDELWNRGHLNSDNVALFAERFFGAPRRETAFDQALDGSLGARYAREIHAIGIWLSDPQFASYKTHQFFNKHGVVGGLGQIATSMVTTPIVAAHQVLTKADGTRLGEKPLRNLVVLLPCALIFGKFLMHVGRVVLPFILQLPNTLWQFTLDRIRELARAVRGEE